MAPKMRFVKVHIHTVIVSQFAILSVQDRITELKTNLAINQSALVYVTELRYA